MVTLSSKHIFFMSAVHEIRGVKIRVKLVPHQPRTHTRDVMSQTAAVLPNCGPNVKQRYALQEVLKQNSIVRAKRGRHLPKVCQKTPRLRAVLLKDQTFYGSDVSSSLPPLSTTSLPSSTQETVHTYLPTSQSPPPLRKSDSFNPLRASESYNPLPPELTLLRRPTQIASTPLANRDVHHLAESVNLRPIVIDNSFTKTVQFYQTHYPLLLERKFEGEPERILTRRCSTPLDSVAVVLKRGKYLSGRVVGFDRKLEELEREMEDGVFITELRSEIFNPVLWPWNLSRYV